VRVGQFVMVAGYPLRGLLSSGINATTGNVSALAGPGDDTRLLQITAPVQPGNSGGPVLDQSGNVIGVVVSQLDSLEIARATGGIPQNVNFAIKGTVVRTFLEAKGVEFTTSPSTTRLDPAAVAERAAKSTILVECWK
jgi:S1-C subfamily serine protease